jgi:hypothetical protein
MYHGPNKAHGIHSKKQTTNPGQVISSTQLVAQPEAFFINKATLAGALIIYFISFDYHNHI